MLYHNVLNSSKHKLGIQTVQGQRAQNQQNTFYKNKNMRTIAEVLNIKLEAAVAVNESEMENKTKLKTVREDEL